jgi:hypothetical protein
LLGTKITDGVGTGKFQVQQISGIDFMKFAVAEPWEVESVLGPIATEKPTSQDLISDG